MTQLEREMKKLAQQAGGAFKTVDDRMALAERFSQRLVRDLNIQIRRVDQLKSRHIEDYIGARLAQGIKPRTLQNEMSAIRSLLREAGRTKLADSERLSSQALGLSGASREGTHLAITPALYQQVLTLAQQKDPGLAAVTELARVMGLRSQEAVQSVKSLNTWQQALERGDPKLTVVYGTKGGRPRETLILDREAVSQAVSTAMKVAEDRRDRLIDKPDLKSAMKYWRDQAARLGMTGKYAPHSLRYAWAQEAITHYLAQGFSESEALALTAMDLGHGDGRGRYVAQVYGHKAGDNTE